MVDISREEEGVARVERHEARGGLEGDLAPRSLLLVRCLRLRLRRAAPPLLRLRAVRRALHRRRRQARSDRARRPGAALGPASVRLLAALGRVQLERQAVQPAQRLLVGHLQVAVLPPTVGAAATARRAVHHEDEAREPRAACLVVDVPLPQAAAWAAGPLGGGRVRPHVGCGAEP